MEKNNAIQLTDENVFPDEIVLQTVLGTGYPLYLELLQIFRGRSLSLEWRYYRDGKAWLGKVQHKKKTVVWMSAWKGFIKATVYVPEREAAGLEDLDLPASTKKRLREAQRVGKSLPCTFDLTDDQAVKELEAVVGFKLVASR